MGFGKPEAVERSRKPLMAVLSAVALNMASMGSAGARQEDYSFSYPNENDPEYSVFHTGFDDSYQVGIEKEPIGPIRRKASSDLARRLGISLKDLCKLTADVSVSYSANPKYAGRDLGFPGCPGSVRLPGDPQF